MTRQQRAKERAEKRSRKRQARERARKMASFGWLSRDIGPKVGYSIRQVQRWLAETPYGRKIGRPSGEDVAERLPVKAMMKNGGTASSLPECQNGGTV